MRAGIGRDAPRLGVDRRDRLLHQADAGLHVLAVREPYGLGRRTAEHDVELRVPEDEAVALVDQRHVDRRRAPRTASCPARGHRSPPRESALGSSWRRFCRKPFRATRRSVRRRVDFGACELAPASFMATVRLPGVSARWPAWRVAPSQRFGGATGRLPGSGLISGAPRGGGAVAAFRTAAGGGGVGRPDAPCLRRRLCSVSSRDWEAAGVGRLGRSTPAAWGKVPRISAQFRHTLAVSAW